MILDIFYLSLIIFAIIVIQTNVLRNAVIYLSVFSLICSIVYLLLGAPDVAIAEAVIGCTLSTILFLVALKKYRIYTVYYSCLIQNNEDIKYLKEQKDSIKQLLNEFSISKELQLDLINTSSSFEQLKQAVSYDVIINHDNDGLYLYGLKNSYQYNELIQLLREKQSIPIHPFFIDEEEVYENSFTEE